MLSIFGKFVVDFCVMGRNTAVKTNKSGLLTDKFILKPRYQTQINGYNYIQAEKGYLNNNDYIFENIKMTGDFGDITSGKLEINEDKNLFIFTEKPNFIIYRED